MQSALLEAMQERQVTIGDNTYPLPQPFLVLATQNPLEQEGTYPLPEAQVDRFMLKAKISYPKKQEERDIVRMNLSGAGMPEVGRVITPDDIVKARKVVEDVYMDEKDREIHHRHHLRHARTRGVQPPEVAEPDRLRRFAPVRRSRWPRPPAPTPSSAAAAMSSPRTCAPSATTCCATASA